jgi:ABC-type antimicrobial peptide transport system permease subunit
MIYLWVMDELSMDKFHKGHERIYQVMTNQNRPDAIVTLGEGPGLLAESLTPLMPEIEKAVSTSQIEDEFTLNHEHAHIHATGQFASQEFFTLFSYPMLHGDVQHVLDKPDAIVISEKTAMSLFNTTENVTGRIVEWQVKNLKRTVMVSGVFKNISAHSSRQFDFILSYEVYKNFLGGENSWGNHNAVTFLQLREQTDIDQFNAKIKDFVKTKSPHSNITLFVKPYAENYLYGRYENGIMTGGRIEYVRLFSLIAIFILVIACINFMNLATAKAASRVKEVGIKKSIGAGRRTLIVQYLSESLMVSFLSMVAGVLLVDLLLTRFNDITGKQLDLTLDAPTLLSLIGIWLVTGLLAGSYPALYLSGFKPVQVLKGKLSASFGEVWARKSLVVIQFVLCLVFIVSVIVVHRQIGFIQEKNLGYNRDNTVYFNIEGNITRRLETFLTEAKKIPGVAQASGMWGSMMGMTGFTTGYFNWEGKDPNQVVQFEHLGVTYDMLELLNISMAQGRRFSREVPSDTNAIILNEAAIAVMGLKDPLGKNFNLWGKEMKIIGITKDFHFKTLHESVKPFFFRLQPRESDKVLVKLEAGKTQDALQALQKLYHAFNPEYAFDYAFLDAEYNRQYAAEMRVADLSRYFAILAIVISCLGLLGLTAFTAERRQKEIGIRKALGASELGIVVLLSGDFTKLVLIAIVIAVPLSYFMTSQWLDSFAFKIALEWWYFAGAGLLALGIAWLTVSSQAIKAARVNPADCLGTDS